MAGGFAARGTGGGGQPLKLQAGHHIRIIAVGVSGKLVFGQHLKAGGHHDGADLFRDQFILLSVIHRAGGAEFLAGAAAAGFEFEAIGAVDHRFVGHGLRKRDADGGAPAEAFVELARQFLLRTFLPAGAAAGALPGIHAARLAAEGDLEIAHVALHPLDFAVGFQADARVRGGLDHARGQDALRAIEGGKGLGQLRHVAAQGRGALHQHHLGAAVGDVERGLEAGDAAADDQRPARDRHADGDQRRVALDAGDDGAHEVNGFARGLFPVRVDPGTLFAEIGDFAQVRIQAGGGAGFAEGLFVHPRRTGPHDHAGELVLADSLADLRLAGLGAGVAVIQGVGHAGQLPRGGRHARAIHRLADVLAAMTNENANPRHLISPSPAPGSPAQNVGPSPGRPRPSPSPSR